MPALLWKCTGLLAVSFALGSFGCQGDPDAGVAVTDRASSAVQCAQRSPGVTGIQAKVRVDDYRGMISGHNGDHELIEGTITRTIWVYESDLVDSSNVEIALNVASSRDPGGLPHEIPVSPGQTIEVGGEYIPQATANAHNDNGSAAVIHFTHAPCGYVTIGGHNYP
jgi:hypothetical protein